MSGSIRIRGLHLRHLLPACEPHVHFFGIRRFINDFSGSCFQNGNNIVTVSTCYRPALESIASSTIGWNWSAGTRRRSIPRSFVSATRNVAGCPVSAVSFSASGVCEHTRLPGMALMRTAWVLPAAAARRCAHRRCSFTPVMQTFRIRDARKSPCGGAASRHFSFSLRDVSAPSDRTVPRWSSVRRAKAAPTP